MPPVALQARPATGLIDTGLVILRRRYWDLFVAELIPAFPFLVLALFVSSKAYGYVRLGEALAAPVAIGIVSCLVSQEFTGNTVALGDAIRRGVRRAPGLIGVWLLSGLSVALGLIGLIVGGFVAAALMYTAVPVYALEDVRANDAIDRSIALARGNVMHVLGVLLGALLGYWIVYYPAAFAITWGWRAASHHGYIPVRVETLVLTFAYLAILPLPHVFPAVVYYDLRVRREGMDIET
ncbi:MAG TPA: hypothetical protein VJO52_11775, partial [Gemmatimonadaceae bacterium]|nr:hypothetical protein [Gemmatimonadaceae bacterium]